MAVDATWPGGGGLYQLFYHGVNGCDCEFTVYGGVIALPANLRESMANRWFVGREDGFATREDLGTDLEFDHRFGDQLINVPLSILSHVPAALGPTTAPDGTMRPFSVKTERAAARIQAAWRDAVGNPGRAVCRRRLLKEFEEMTSM
jgi:hypothetical protein